MQDSYNQNMTISITSWSSKLHVCLQQTWFDNIASLARVSCGKFWLLHSRSRSQWRSKRSVTVCLDDIFRTSEHFVTELGMVLQHHEPEPHVEEILFAVFKVKVMVRARNFYYQNMNLSTISSTQLILWQPNLVWCYIIISQYVLWKKLDYCIQGQGQSKGSNCHCFCRWYLLNCPTFCYQIWYCDESSWAWVHYAKRFVCYFQGHGHSKGSYDQNMTASTISSELLIHLLPGLVW